MSRIVVSCLKKVKTFTYRGSTLVEGGELEDSVCSVVRQGNEREDQWEGGYRTVVRPALMWVAEKWALTKAQENKLEVAEMRMLRWMFRVTKMDKIRNNKVDNESGGKRKGSPGKGVEVTRRE